MSDGRRSYTFQELIDQSALEIGDGYRAKNSELGGDGPAFMRAGRLSARGWDWDGIERFQLSLENKVASKVSRLGDTVITTKGNSTGRTGYVAPGTPSFVYSPHLSYWRSRNGQVIDGRYLRYWALSSELTEQLASLAHGTDMAPYLSLGDQKRLLITLPGIGEQRDVAAVLGALDDKIAVNQRIVSTANDLMLARFEGAVSGEAAEVPLSDVALFHNRKRVPLSSRERSEIPGPYPYYGAAGIVDHIKEFLFSGPHVLVGEDGTVVTGDGRPVVQYVWGDFWVNNHAHVLTGTRISTELLAIALRIPNVASLVTGAVQPKLNMSNLQQLRLRIPFESTRNQLEAVAASLWEVVRLREDESRTLATLRDTLLPQLMSGRLRVKEAEKIVEDAT